jgi:hypothetical protein
MSNIGSGTAKGLVEYLDSLVDRGRAPVGAITPLKTAFSKMLEAVEGKNWGDTDIREFDFEDYTTRFANLTMGKYSDDSLRIYNGRVKKVVGWYLTFLSKPGWSPSFKSSGAKTVPKEGKNAQKEQIQKVEQNVEHPAPSVQNETGSRAQDNNQGERPDDGLISYPFPLATGKLVTLYLPIKLEQADADRIAGFLQTLVVDKG